VIVRQVFLAGEGRCDIGNAADVVDRIRSRA
jgi:hypothetical protein